MSGTWFIQITESFGSYCSDATEALHELSKQDGFAGGRLLLPSPSEPDWRVQAFMWDEPEAAEFPERLPDGVRRVFVMDSLRVSLGIPTDYKAPIVKDDETKPHHSSCKCAECEAF